MKGITIIYLVLTLLTSQACSTEIANTQVLTSNSQEINLNQKRREVNENLAKIIALKEQSVEADKTSIKDTKGLIVLSDRYRKNDFVRFYDENGSLWYEFTFYYDDSDGKFEYENENFEPFAFHPDHFLLALKCVDDNGSRYEVIVNEKTGLKKFVKKNDSTIKFETWEEHIKRVFAVSFNQEKNPLRESLEGSVKNTDLPKEVTFHPVEIKGEWLKVRWEGSKKAKNDVGSGWLKWRENNNLLVELFYFS